MKVRFKCVKCGAENEFETKGATQLLLEMKTQNREAIYIIKCKKCGAENQIRVRI